MSLEESLMIELPNSKIIIMHVSVKKESPALSYMGRTPPRLIAVSKLYDCCTAIRSGGVIAVWFVVYDLLYDCCMIFDRE